MLGIKVKLLNFSISGSFAAICALWLVLVNCAVGGYGNTGGDEAMTHYLAGRYKHAVNAFDRVLASDPANQKLRYFLANALVKCDEHERAAQEYELAYKIDSHSTIAGYCKQALLSYKKPVPEGNFNFGAKAKNKVIAGATPAIPVQKSGSSETKPAAISGSVHVNRALSNIRRQAAYEKDKHRRLANTSMDILTGSRLEKARDIDARAQMEVEKLYEPIIYTPGPRANPLLMYPDLLKSRETQIRQAAQDAKEALIRQEEAQANRYKSWVKEREVALDEVAANLENQLDTPQKSSGVKLHAVGTDLYVRYYGNSGTPAPEVHNAVVRIVTEPPPGKYSASEELPLTSQSAEARQGLLPRKSVRGRLLAR